MQRLQDFLNSLDWPTIYASVCALGSIIFNIIVIKFKTRKSVLEKKMIKAYNNLDVVDFSGYYTIVDGKKVELSTLRIYKK